MTNTNMTKLVVILLVGLLALSNTVSVQAKGNLVRGAHSSKSLKHHSSMAARKLMKEQDKYPDAVEAAEKEQDDDEEDDDEEEDDKVQGAEEEETDAPDDKDNDDDATDAPDDKEDDEATDAPVDENEEEVPDVVDPVDGASETTPEEGEPVVEEPLPEVLPEEVTPDATPSTPNANDTIFTVMPDEEFSVPLDPFSLTVNGDITEDDLNLEKFLFNYMQTFMPNLVSIDLESETVLEGQTDADDAPSADEGNSTGRMLRVTSRGLTVQTFYFEGNASFVGPPMRTHKEVDAALTYALGDTAALKAHLEAEFSFSSVNIAITANTGDGKPITDAVSAKEDDSDGISTTGLSIVIVASCVGGISLLIILMVGLSGPPGDTTGMKGGLPEQPLQ